MYEVVAERYPTWSSIITNNRPSQDGVTLLPDPVMADSALDRLSHHAHHIMIDGGESCRKKLGPKTAVAVSRLLREKRGITVALEVGNKRGA